MYNIRITKDDGTVLYNQQSNCILACVEEDAGDTYHYKQLRLFNGCTYGRLAFNLKSAERAIYDQLLESSEARKEYLKLTPNPRRAFSFRDDIVSKPADPEKINGIFDPEDFESNDEDDDIGDEDWDEDFDDEDEDSFDFEVDSDED